MRADLGQLSLAYRLCGPPSSPRVLVISPSSSNLADLPPRFHTESFRFLFYDHRGTGASSMPSPRWGEPSMEALARDAIGLLGAVGWSACHVVGLSFGARFQPSLAASPAAADTSPHFISHSVPPKCASIHSLPPLFPPPQLQPPSLPPHSLPPSPPTFRSCLFASHFSIFSLPPTHLSSCSVEVALRIASFSPRLHPAPSPPTDVSFHHRR